MNKLLYSALFLILLVAPTLAKVSLISNSRSYELRTTAGPDHDEFIAPAVSLYLCDSSTLVSAYSSDLCWSQGSGISDSSWALLYGNQFTCVDTILAVDQVGSISSSSSITGGAIYSGCDIGTPSAYRSDGSAAASFIIEVTDAPIDYALSYDVLGNDWGGLISGGTTSISGFIKLSNSAGAILAKDSLFIGVEIANKLSSGTLQPGTYEISYRINQTHSGTDVLAWYPAGQSIIAFSLVFTSDLCGDVDATGRLDISDGVYLINYIFAGGTAPLDARAGDVNCSNQTDVSDAVYMINFIFAGGPSPCAGCP